MKENLTRARGKLHGVMLELYETELDFEVDDELRQLAEKVVLKANDVRRHIN